MPDLLNTSLTGMLAFQRALGVTSHNIANANTPGYSRQVADFSTRPGSGASPIGSGVQIANIRRVYDAMIGQQLATSTTSQVRFDTLNTLSSRMDSLLADADTGLNSGLQSFFNAVQDVANDPASVPTRQALLGEATGLAGRFNSLQGRLDEIDGEVDQRLTLAVAEINQLAEQIADINGQIAIASGGTVQPNDLLDQRDRLVLDLSKQVSVSTTIQNDGSMNVFIGSGQSLVVGGQVQSLGVSSSEFDPTRMVVSYQGASGSTPLDTSLTGGALGGLLEFRAGLLDPAMQSLGQTAIAFAQQFNQQHASGMDLRGSLGGSFFDLAPPGVLHSSNNTGSGSATAAVTDPGAMTGANYILNYDGAAYSLMREGTNAIVPMTGSGTAVDPFVAAGVEIVVGGAPAAGDQLMIRTAQDAAGSLSNLVSDPQSIAMAGATRSAASLSNTGSGSISPASTFDATDPQLLNPATIQFLDATTYSINGAGAFAYTDGSPININGTSVTITGAPVAGDQFTIEANFGASGDNSNGLTLANIQSIGVLDGGSISISENYGRLVSTVGATTHQVQMSLDAQNVVLRNAEDAMLSNSAVNLDEEAAKLIQYQQAYQAVARVVSVASTLFDSLLAATNR